MPARLAVLPHKPIFRIGGVAAALEVAGGDEVGEVFLGGPLGDIQEEPDIDDVEMPFGGDVGEQAFEAGLPLLPARGEAEAAERGGVEDVCSASSRIGNWRIDG